MPHPPAEYRIELRHLQAFAVLGHELHFGRAASRLHLGQPALTKQIQQLEEALGAKLLHRGSRSVTLTEPGRAFLVEAERTLAQKHRAVEAAMRAQRGETGVLRVAFAASAPNGIFPYVVRAFRDRHPDVRLDLVEMWSHDQAQALIEDRLDVGFGTPTATTSALLAAETLQEDPVIVAVHESDSIAAHAEIELAQLADEPFIFFPRAMAPAYHDSLLASCHQAGFSPRIVQEVLEVNATLGLVAAGLGVALLPRTVRTLHRDGVRYVGIGDGAPIATMGVVWRRDDESIVLRRFLDAARVARTMGPLDPLSPDRRPAA